MNITDNGGTFGLSCQKGFEMKVGDKAVICTENTRWCKGTEVEILYISKNRSDPKPIYVKQVEGNLNSWIGYSDLKGV